MSFSDFGLKPVDGVNIAILLTLFWILYRVVSSESNAIIWADFVSSRGMDGRQHGDLTKVGQLVGIVVAAMSVLQYADNATVDAVGLAALLGVALAYLGGVSAYSAFLRSKQGQTETTRTTDFTQPTTRTETTTGPAP